MSGGHFDYAQFRINDIAQQIDEIVEGQQEINGEHFDEEVLELFRKASVTLKKAQAMATRIDWLLSGDDGIESFKERWKKEGL
ncbi:MAG: hypothetical protein ABFD50_17905 [Smithella sp.]